MAGVVPVTEPNGPSAVVRAFQVVAQISRRGRPATLAELVATTALPKSTLHRMLRQLVALGALEQEGTRYRIGLSVFEWGSSAECQRELRQVAIPHLTELRNRVGETVHMAVLSGDDIVYVEKLEPARATVLPSYVGGRWPAHCSALGKAMLAFTPGGVERAGQHRTRRQTSYTILEPGRVQRQLIQVRRTGVSLDIEESVVGVACIAAPVTGPDGHTRAAISVSSPTVRFNRARTAQALRRTATLVSRELATRAEDRVANPY